MGRVRHCAGPAFISVYAVPGQASSCRSEGGEELEELEVRDGSLPMHTKLDVGLVGGEGGDLPASCTGT